MKFEELKKREILSPFFTNSHSGLWKQNDETCFTIGGLRDRIPKCCAARSSSDPDSVIIAISDGDGGVLLWPLDKNAASPHSLGLDSRHTKRLPNKSPYLKAINIAAAAANIFVVYDDGSLNVFLLSTSAYGLEVTLKNTYASHTNLNAVNLSPPNSYNQDGTIYAVHADDRPTTTLIAYLGGTLMNSTF